MIRLFEWRKIVFCSREQKVKLWDLKTNDVQTLFQSKELVRELVFSKDNTLVLALAYQCELNPALSSNGTFTAYSIATGEHLRKYISGNISRGLITRDGQIFIGFIDGSIQRFAYQPAVLRPEKEIKRNRAEFFAASVSSAVVSSAETQRVLDFS
jgi:hypothetical protein